MTNDQRNKKLELAVKDLRILCVRIGRQKDEDKRAELIGHAIRISEAVGCGPSPLRDEYTEGGAQ